ncbi:MAG: hypothetical protein Q4G71_02910 [Pseudomonadota bacterium]|nr:hypothetical protein [Pseudomonadota bacterium]
MNEQAHAVIPAKAGIQRLRQCNGRIAAFAGMTDFFHVIGFRSNKPPAVYFKPEKP